MHILVMPWANIIAIPYCAAGARPSVLSIQGAPLRLRAGGPSGGMPFGHIMSLSRDVCSRVSPAALRTGHGLLSLRLLSARFFCCVIKPKNDLVFAPYSTREFQFMTVVWILVLSMSTLKCSQPSGTSKMADSAGSHAFDSSCILAGCLPSRMSCPSRTSLFRRIFCWREIS